MPGFEKMMNSFAFDQRAGKNRAKERRTRAWFEAFDVDSPRQIRKFLLRDAALAKSVAGFFRKHEQESGQIVLFNRTSRTQHELIFPATEGSTLFGGARLSPRSDALGKIPVPGRDFYDRWNSHALRNTQGFQAIARPTVKQIVTPGRELARCDPIQILFLGAIIIRSIQRREQPHRVPAQRLDFRRWNFVLSIVVGDRFAQESAVV